MEERAVEEILDGIFSHLGRDFVLTFKQLTIPLGGDYSFYKFGFMDCRTVRPGEDRKKVMEESIKFVDKLCEREVRKVQGK